MQLSQEALSPSQAVERSRCPLAWAHDLVGGRWKQTIIWWLSREPRTFLSLKRRLPGISAKVLTEQLNELSASSLVTRTEEFSGRVRRVRYALTRSGQALVPTLEALCRWAAEHSSQSRSTE